LFELINIVFGVKNHVQGICFNDCTMLYNLNPLFTNLKGGISLCSTIKAAVSLLLPLFCIVHSYYGAYRRHNVNRPTKLLSARSSEGFIAKALVQH